jgi:hypothetical protein
LNEKEGIFAPNKGSLIVLRAKPSVCLNNTLLIDKSPFCSVRQTSLGRPAAVDWEMNRMSIPEPEVAIQHGRGIRCCPIFPELRLILDEAFDIFGSESE